jgi:hypothetical protein
MPPLQPRLSAHAPIFSCVLNHSTGSSAWFHVRPLLTSLSPDFLLGAPVFLPFFLQALARDFMVKTRRRKGMSDDVSINKVRAPCSFLCWWHGISCLKT